MDNWKLNDLFESIHEQEDYSKTEIEKEIRAIAQFAYRNAEEYCHYVSSQITLLQQKKEYEPKT